ncbi:MAG: helix-turn-helix domain-containing protein [Rhodospirillales bacterium]
MRFNHREEYMRPMTVKQVAMCLQYSERTVRRLIASGELKAVKIGGQWRITREAFDQFVGTPF